MEKEKRVSNETSKTKFSKLKNASQLYDLKISINVRKKYCGWKMNRNFQCAKLVMK